MASIQPLESVERLVNILAAINAHDGINITDLSRTCALSRAAVNRYVITLVDLGYVFQDTRSRAYRPTTKTHELSRGVNREEALKTAVLPLMQDTCKEIGWPLNFSRVKNSQLTLIAHTDDVSPLATRQRESLLMRPLVGRAAGHVLLAYMPDSIKSDVLTIAEQEDPDLFTRTDFDAVTLEQHLHGVRKQEYAMQIAPGSRLNSIAVPIHLRSGVPFSLSVGVDAAVLQRNVLVDRLLKPLNKCAHAIGKCLANVDTDRWLNASANGTSHSHKGERQT